MRNVHIEIRQASSEDISGTVDLVGSLSLKTRGPANGGFIVAPYSAEKYREFASQGLLKIAHEKGEVLGFLLSFPWNHPAIKFEREGVTQLNWIKYRELSDSRHREYETGIYVGQIGVRAESINKGIGRRLYAELIREHPEASLMAAVLELPYPNHVSARFHLSSGFERAASFEADTFLGLSPYRAGIYYRPAAHRPHN